jgi:hypothetical protein
MKPLMLAHACSSQWLVFAQKHVLHPRPASTRMRRVSESAASSFNKTASTRQDYRQTLHDTRFGGALRGMSARPL